MGQVPPECGEISRVLRFSDEEIGQMEPYAPSKAEADALRASLSPDQKSRLEELTEELNGSLPAHLSFSFDALRTMVRHMTPEQVLELNTPGSRSRRNAAPSRPCRTGSSAGPSMAMVISASRS